MKVLGLCFFSLLVLAVSVQAQDANKLSGIDAKLSETAIRVKGLLGSSSDDRKRQLLDKIAQAITSLKKSPDLCSVSKLTKVQKLQSDVQAAPNCAAIQNFTEEIKKIIDGTVGVIGEAAHSTLDIVKELVKCVTGNPLQAAAPLQCIVQAAGLTVNDGLHIVTQTIHLGLETVGAFTKLVEGILQCDQIQQGFESRFDDIMKPGC